MPAPFEVIARLEGLAATFTNSGGNPPQSVATWVEACKAIMRSPLNRNRTTWDFVGTSIDLDETEETIESSAGTLFAVLGIKKTEDEAVIFSTYDAANPTVASTDLNDAGTLTASFIVTGASATTAVYGGAVYPHGIPHATAIVVAATELDEGTAIAVDSCQAFVLFTTD